MEDQPQPPVPLGFPKEEEVTRFFDSITLDERVSYEVYWGSIAPQDYLEVFERWLFAFCSVHTSWQGNIRGFQAIKPWFGWYQSSDELRQRLVQSSIGLHHNRTRFIGEFCDKFWATPKHYYKKETESWQEYRERLVKDILGLGYAKVSFALEMIYPTQAEVVCLDTHMFQAYGLDQVKHSKKYKDLEVHWISNCNRTQVPSCVARAIYWDRKQGHKDSRYWTHVLETK